MTPHLEQRLAEIAAEKGYHPASEYVHAMRLAVAAALECAWQPLKTAPDGIHLRAAWIYNNVHNDWFVEVHSGYVDHDGQFVNQYGDDYGIDPDEYFGWQPQPEHPNEHD